MNATLARVRKWDDYARARPNLAGIVLATLVLAMAVLLITPRFGTPDDAALVMMATGAGYATHLGDALFQTFPFLPGRALIFLYQTMPRVPWYALYLFFAYWLVFFCLFRGLAGAASPSRPLRWLLGAALTTYFLFHGFTAPSYTGCGLLLAVAGSALFFAHLSEPVQDVRLVVIAGAIAGFSAFLRIETAFLGIVAMLPVAASVALRGARERRLVGIFLLAAFIVGAVSERTDRWFFSHDPAWTEYRKTYQELVRFFDYGAGDPIGTGSEHLHAVGWDDAEYNLLMNNFLVTGPVFDAEKMRRALHAAPLVRSRKIQRVRETIDALIVAPFIGRILFFSAVALLLLGASQSASLLILAQALFLFAIFTGMGAMMKLPERIFEPLSVALAFLVVLAPPRRQNTLGIAKLRGHALTAVCVLVAIACTSKLRAWSRYQRPQDTSIELREAMRQLGPRPNELFIIWSSLGEWGLSLYSDMRDVFGGFKVLDAGALGADAPYGRHRREEFQLGDVYRAPFDRPDVFLVSSPTRNEVYRKFVRKHYNVDVTFQKRYECRFFTVFRAVPTPISSSGSKFPASLPPDDGA